MLRPLPEGMELFRLEVGHEHEIQPGNIVGAIANEAGLDAEHIGHIDIKDTYSFVELPEGMPKAVLNDLKKTWVGGQQLKITRHNAKSAKSAKSKGGSVEKKPRKPSSVKKKRSGKKTESGDKKAQRAPRRRTTVKEPPAGDK